MISAKLKNVTKSTLRKNAYWKKHYPFYIMLAPVVLYYIIFCYLPMFGVVIAFKDYDIYTGVLDSPWVGVKYFKQFFSSIYFWRLIKNTLFISLYDIVFCFPAPIILALLFNELTNAKFKKTVQTISYLPHFVSSVVIVSLVLNFVSLNNGLVNNIIKACGGEPIYFLSEPKYFRSIYTIMNLYKNIGWSSIVYISAISGVSTELIEACVIDGGNHWHRIRHIILPTISNTIVVLFILRMGSLLSIGYENIILLYNPKLYETADVVQTYVYRSGLLEANYSFSTAVGLFMSIVGMISVAVTNYISRRVSDMSLW